MKVRHKRLWQDQKYEWTVVDESTSFYIARQEGPNLHALDKNDYEPVTEKWVDVTEKCKIGQGISMHPDERSRQSILFEFSCGKQDVLHSSHLSEFRVRKVQARRFENGIIVGSDYDSAFIVERKEPS